MTDCECFGNAQDTTDCEYFCQLTGRVVYTCMLNQHGGVESDLTVSRLPDDAVLTQSLAQTSHPIFYVACGGAVSQYVFGHIQRELETKGLDASLVDVSDQFGLLSLQGPKR